MGANEGSAELHADGNAVSNAIEHALVDDNDAAANRCSLFTAQHSASQRRPDVAAHSWLDRAPASRDELQPDNHPC